MTHRETYPEQYAHPLVGKRVHVRQSDTLTATVTRVVLTRFGPLAILDGNSETAYALRDLTIVVPCCVEGCDRPATYQCGCSPARYCRPCGEAQGCAETLPTVGTRVRLTQDVERYPHFIAAKGLTGTVTVNEGDLFCVRLDVPLLGAEEWENEVQWAHVNGLDDEDPLQDIEVIGESAVIP